MKTIGNQIIPDKFLKEYSYEGRGGKKEFRQYKNVIELIVLCSMDAFNNYNDAKITKEEVEFYFRTQYIKHAKQRHDRSEKK